MSLRKKIKQTLAIQLHGYGQASATVLPLVKFMPRSRVAGQLCRKSLRRWVWFRHADRLCHPFR